MKPSEILLGAADLIELKGHCHGSYESYNGHLCAIGALRKTVHVAAQLRESE